MTIHQEAKGRVGVEFRARDGGGSNSREGRQGMAERRTHGTRLVGYFIGRAFALTTRPSRVDCHGVLLAMPLSTGVRWG
jgi:hypothetical protein